LARRRTRTFSERDTSRITSGLPDDLFLDVIRPTPLPQLPINTFRDPVAVLSEIEDRRTWHPDTILSAPFRSLRRSRVSLSPRSISPRSRSFRSAGMSSRPIFSFAAPRYVAVCIRRKRRREVMFASGYGGRGYRRRRRSAYTSIRC